MPSFYSIQSLCFTLQVCADDVLTKEEQISLLFRAKQKCEGIIEAKHKVPGKWEVNRKGAFLIGYSAANSTGSMHYSSVGKGRSHGANFVVMIIIC